MPTKIMLKSKDGSAPGFPGFIAWLASTHPQVYNMVAVAEPEATQFYESDHASGSLLSGDEPAPQASRVQQFVDAITSAGSALLSLNQQKKILAVQLDRAKRGLQPLDVGAYVDPNQGVNVGLNPATRKTMLWLGGGLLAAVVLTRVLGRR